MMKTAHNEHEAWKIQETYAEDPHAWIQWQGTNVCMDIYCACGEQSHLDADFAYHIECPHCHRVYFCNGHIELIKLEERPDTCVQVAEF